MLNTYLDSDGFPGSVNDGVFDGGDTAAILGTLIALEPKLLDRVNWTRLLPFLWDGKTMVRHPDETKWYSRGDRFSRDQLIPMICAGIVHRSPTIEALFYAHQRRWFLLAWNTRKNGAIDVPKKFPDITGPEIWALWLRYKKPWWARIFLNLADVETLVSSIFWRLFRKDRVCRNHMLVTIIARRYKPTLISRLAYWLNDWNDLIPRWWHHCEACGEYPTADLFWRNVEKRN